MRFNAQDLMIAALFGVVYFAAARLGTALHLPVEHIAIAWPAAGIALAALALANRRQWPPLILALFVANVVANLAVGAAPLTAVGVSIADILESAGGAWVVCRIGGRPLDMSKVSHVVGVAVAAATISPLAAALGALFPTLATGTSYFENWRQFWIVDGVGIVVLAPALFSCAALSPEWRQKIFGNKGLEFGALLISTAIVAAGVSYLDVHSDNSVWSGRYFVFPFLIWGALRFGPPGAALTSLVTSTAAVAVAILSTHVLRVGVEEDPVLALQVFLCVANLSSSGLAAFDARRRVLEAKLLKTQKMEAVGLLASGVAHDFNNMLTVVLTQGNLLIHALAADEQKRRKAEIIMQAGNRAAALTRQLLSFSRRQIVQTKVVNLNEQIESSKDLLRRMVRENIDLSFDLRATGVHTRIDAAQIDQMLINLIVNACDAMPHGGGLAVGTAIREFAVNAPELPPNVRPGRYVVLSVRDNGSGITPATMEHIFEPFFTTKPPSRGTGLGLATVQAAAQQSGGFTHVASTIGEGSVFTIYLPTIEAASEEQAWPSPVAKRNPANSTILVVEDQSEVRLAMQDALTQAAFHVFAAAMPGEAIAMSEQIKEPIDLVISDGIMPEMNGPELVRRLLLRRPGMKVLFVSGYPDEQAFTGVTAAERLFFLQKPFGSDLLLQEVEKILDL